MEIVQTYATGSNATTASQSDNSRNSAISSDFETFLKMLTVQMENQDPLNPVDSADYAVQLATFSGVEQQVQTNDLLETLGQKMGLTGLSQIAGWVGMEARVQAPVYFGGAPISVFAPSNSGADQAFLVVRDSNGTQADHSEIDPAGGQLQWAGVDASGAPFPAGTYSFSVESRADGAVISTDPAQVYALVTEAKLDNGVAMIALAGGSELPADQISAIRTPG
ncbi:MAG: flagellar hook assembly protein FlgD [Marinosulfonomonas sp.]|nr:flagellar hook assembly protein FlgD [Marinosulfonomonas sp.]